MLRLRLRDRAPEAGPHRCTDAGRLRLTHSFPSAPAFGLAPPFAKKVHAAVMLVSATLMRHASRDELVAPGSRCRRLECRDQSPARGSGKSWSGSETVLSEMLHRLCDVALQRSCTEGSEKLS